MVVIRVTGAPRSGGTRAEIVFDGRTDTEQQKRVAARGVMTFPTLPYRGGCESRAAAPSLLLSSIHVY
jgi:hypothetical protein